MACCSCLHLRCCLYCCFCCCCGSSACTCCRRSLRIAFDAVITPSDLARLPLPLLLTLPLHFAMIIASQIRVLSLEWVIVHIHLPLHKRALHPHGCGLISTRCELSAVRCGLRAAVSAWWDRGGRRGCGGLGRTRGEARSESRSC